MVITQLHFLLANHRLPYALPLLLISLKVNLHFTHLQQVVERFMDLVKLNLAQHFATTMYYQKVKPGLKDSN